jgi:hypothetical protein
VGGVTSPGTACATGGAGGPGGGAPEQDDVSQGLPGSNGSYLQGGAGGEGGLYVTDDGMFVLSGYGGGGGGGGYCGGGSGGGQAADPYSQPTSGGGGGSSYGVGVGLSNEFYASAPASVQINYVAITTAPVLSTPGGSAQVGDGLAVTSGTWQSPDARTYSYQWQWCDGTGSGCVDVDDPAADPTTYALTSADAGHVMQVVVTATDKGMRSAVASDQSAVIAQARPAISATAGGPLVAGTGTWSDSATLSGGVAPTGTISFGVYRASDTSCSTPVATASAPVSGAGTYSSPAFTPAGPSAAGVYEIVASYPGDTGNAGIATGCADPAGSVTANKATPAIANAPVGGAAVGQHVSDAATLSAGPSATGTVTFSLYGPDDPTCAGSPVTSTSTVAGNGTYQSDAQQVTAPGTYEWVAAYGGDAGDVSAATACGDASFVVGQASPTVSTTPSATIIIGATFYDSATLSGGYAESGTITFDVYGPGDTTCTGPAVFDSTAVPSGDGTYDSGAFEPTILGTYRFVVSYAGDGDNLAASSGCGDETVDVDKAQPTLSTGSTSATGGRGTSGGVRVSQVFLRAHGWVSVRLVVAVPGTVSLIVTGPREAAKFAARASRRIVIGHRRFVARRAERVTVRVRLTRRGQVLLTGYPRALLRLSVRFTPAGGRPRKPRTYRVRRSHRAARH